MEMKRTATFKIEYNTFGQKLFMEESIEVDSVLKAIYLVSETGKRQEITPSWLGGLSVERKAAIEAAIQALKGF